MRIFLAAAIFSHKLHNEEPTLRHFSFFSVFFFRAKLSKQRVRSSGGKEGEDERKWHVIHSGKSYYKIVVFAKQKGKKRNNTIMIRYG